MIYANLPQRIFAQLLDYLVFCIVFFPVTYLVKGTWLMTPEDHLWIIFDPRKQGWHDKLARTVVMRVK